MDLTSIRAKGVQPLTSERATLPGWELLFNVAHYFRHEGGVGNIRETGQTGDVVQGVVHLCEGDDLSRLDAVEAYGVGYDRVEVQVETGRESLTAIVYVGFPGFIDDDCKPTQRYMNILLKGARNAKLEDDYINKLQSYPVHSKKTYPMFEHPKGINQVFNTQNLSEHPGYTAIAGAVFDMEGARWQHEHLKDLFGGRDMTLWHLQRLDSSDGNETMDDIRQNRLHKKQRFYLNEYLHEYNQEYTYVGRFEY
jgi:hypothetical protein